MKKKWMRSLFRRRFFVILSLLFQLLAFTYLIINTSLSSEIIGGILTLLSIFVALGIISKRVKPAFKLTWVFLILRFPIFGGLYYLFWEVQKTGGPAVRRLRRFEEHAHKYLRMAQKTPTDKAAELAPVYERQIRYLDSFAGFPAYTDTSVEYLPSGEAKLEKLIEELEKAKHYIFLEYFIIEDGVMWQRILEVLRRKAAQGVLVRVMYDDFGCFLKLPSDYVKTLEGFGIEAAVFNTFKPLFSCEQNNRDHRKIVSIDGKAAFTGGINIADEYINVKDIHGHWKDTAVFLEGSAAWSLTVIFLGLWSYTTGVYEDFSKFLPDISEPNNRCGCTEGNTGVVLPYSDSPTDTENVGEHVYLNIINTAKRYVYIDTPYLILDDSVTSALCLAAKSGVDVRITTPSVPDRKFVHDTTRTYYDELLAAGVRIYEYASGFIHAKTFVSDDITATVGTANLDFRSLYLHFECGVWLYGCDAVKEIKEDYLRTLEECTEIHQSGKKPGIAGRFKREVLRLLAPLM